jgi:ribosomal protein S18 acetylase RimI-like enzyme
MPTSSSFDVTKTPLKFRRATEQDTEALRSFAYKVFYETFAPYNTPENLTEYMRQAFSSEKIKAEILDPTNVFVVAELQQAFIAYYKLTTGFDRTDTALPAGIAEQSSSILLERFYVDFSWHGTPVAQQMMQHCLELAQSLKQQVLFLGVWEKNLRAQKFYQKWGFEIVGSHPFVVGDEIQIDFWMSRLLKEC